mmetsp:Transcript_1563/g.5147  ORF Transcript_1563/g.5147 Transcript_1563/m.5147 type:complete len:368 (-) Transcript_1563:961-2064(-)
MHRAAARGTTGREREGPVSYQETRCPPGPSLCGSLPGADLQAWYIRRREFHTARTADSCFVRVAGSLAGRNCAFLQGAKALDHRPVCHFWHGPPGLASRGGAQVAVSHPLRRAFHPLRDTAARYCRHGATVDSSIRVQSGHGRVLLRAHHPLVVRGTGKPVQWERGRRPDAGGAHQHTWCVYHPHGAWICVGVDLVGSRGVQPAGAAEDAHPDGAVPAVCRHRSAASESCFCLEGQEQEGPGAYVDDVSVHHALAPAEHRIGCAAANRPGSDFHGAGVGDWRALGVFGAQHVCDRDDEVQCGPEGTCGDPEGAHSLHEREDPAGSRGCHLSVGRFDACEHGVCNPPLYFLAHPADGDRFRARRALEP